jgi:IS5 family transposase
MPPKKPKLRDEELFRMQLTNMIDMEHPLVKAAQLIDWSQFDEGFGRFYTQKGRAGLPTRLLAGLHLLKHMEGLSDEAVCKRWVENPYHRAPRAHVSGMLGRKEETNESHALCCERACTR